METLTENAHYILALADLLLESFVARFQRRHFSVNNLLRCDIDYIYDVPQLAHWRAWDEVEQETAETRRSELLVMMC